MLSQNAVWFEWPFDPHRGSEVRFYDPIGPFIVKRIGATWIVSDTREWPLKGVEFDNLNTAIAHMNENL